MAGIQDPFALRDNFNKVDSLEQQAARAQDQEPFRVQDDQRVSGEVMPKQTPEPPGAYLSWGVAAVIFAYLIPIVGILMAGIAISKVSNAKKYGYSTRKMQTTKVLGIIALILAAVTILVSAILLRIQ